MAEINPKIAEDFANALNSMSQAFSELKGPVGEFGKSFSGSTSAAKDMVNLLGKMSKQFKGFKKLQGDMLKLRNLEEKQIKKIVDHLEGGVSKTKKLEKLTKDYKSAWDSVGSAMKKPTMFLDKFASSLSSMLGANTLKEAFSPLITGAKALFSPGGLLVAGVLLAFAAFKQLWSFMNDKVLPASAEFVRTIGNMGKSTAQLKQQMIGTGVRFEMLGLSFKEGATLVRDLAANMMQVKFPKETLETGLKLSKVVGLNAEQSGKMMLFFQKTTGSLDGLNESMDKASGIANKYQVPLSQIRKDMADNLDIVARFGTRNRMVMLDASARARSYGLSIKEVNAAFGEQMDTFEGTSNVAAKLNAIFGTQINSYELMLETNPQKRMEMLRKELLKQGKSWEDLNVFEQNVITSNLKIDKTQAALFLSSDKARKKLEAQANQQAKLDKINRDWNKGLSQIQETLIPWVPLLDKLLRSIGRFISILITGEDPYKNFGKAAKSVTEGMNKFTNAIDNIDVESIKTIGNVLDTALVTPLKLIAEFAAKSGETLGKLFSRSEFSHDLASVESLMQSMSKGGALNKKSFENIKQQFPEVFESMAGKKLASKYGVDDALITKKGEVVKFNPQDNILATKAPISRTAGGASATAGRGSSTEERIVIMPAPIYLDSKVIAEQIFRVSRK